MVETITKEIQFRFVHFFSLTAGYRKQRYTVSMRHTAKNASFISECYKKSRGPMFK